jgi:CRISPR/Cas system type I-B associated protein Csh2 (Cas7 group RAMP superfamily)
MKNYILYSLKLDMEELMESHVKNVKGYEELRFDLRNHYDVITLEGKCRSCGHPSPISIKIFEYIDRIKLLANNHVNTGCGVCGRDSSIDIPRL